MLIVNLLNVLVQQNNSQDDNRDKFYTDNAFSLNLLILRTAMEIFMMSHKGKSDTYYL